MIFDDHDVHDDWNISESWLEEMRATDWWDEHCIGAMMSYWVYQHLGNLTPELIRDDPVLARLKETDDGEQVLREFVRGGDRERSGSRWSYCRDIGGTRLIVIDARAGRVLEEDNRKMVDDAEWDWIVEHTQGDFDHLLLGTSLPYLLGPGMQYARGLERGGGRRRLGRAHGRLRREGCARSSTSSTGARSSARSTRWSSCSAPSEPGERGRAPASIVTLSGDVHHAYLFEIAYPKGSRGRERDLAGRLLALPQPARRQGAQDHPDGHVAPVRSGSGRSSRSAPASRIPASAGGSRAAARGSTTRSRRS